MSDSEILAAEYRAFVKALHPASIETLVTVDDFWLDRLYPILRKRQPSQLLADAIYDDFARRARPGLLTLASGHPDPDVRAAADDLHTALERLIVEHTAEPVANFDRTSALTMRLLDRLRALRAALYHAPFRVERPTPDFNGELLNDTAIRAMKWPADR